MKKPDFDNRSNGGGIFVQGSAVSLNNVTIANNSARAAGGGISRINGIVNIRNTIIANNDNPTSPDVSGRFTDLGNNLIGTSDGSIGFNVSTLVGMIANPINPRLSSLQDNGGSTPTQALLPNSPAINAGAVSRVTTDQRGVSRRGIRDNAAPNQSFNIPILTTATSNRTVNLNLTVPRNAVFG